MGGTWNEAPDTKRTDAMTDPLESLMSRFDIPISRETYLELAYMGSVPELDAETEAELPPAAQVP
jgi:hypothetical protein